MDNVKLWLHANKLTLNVNKTKLLFIGSPQRLIDTGNVQIKFKGTSIEQCKSVKCLGVIIDEHLNWSEQINHVCKKVFFSLSMLRRIKPYVPKYTMTLLYLCLIQSQIDYCCEIWGAHAINQTERIIKLQKRAVRMILRLLYSFI